MNQVKDFLAWLDELGFKKTRKTDYTRMGARSRQKQYVMNRVDGQTHVTVGQGRALFRFNKRGVLIGGVL